MKKWSQYLKENQKEVLNEFNKKDEESVMADQEKFTVAFEIEMEAEGFDEDDMYEAEQEARREAAENYFGYDADEHFRTDTYDNLTPEQIGMEEPDDGAEMLDWYYENTSTNPTQLEIIQLALAYQDDTDAEEIFDTAIDKILNDPMPFLKMIYGNSTRISELQDLLGWTDKQMTMGFELEGGKAFPEPLERIGASRGAMLKIIDYFLIKLKSLSGRARPGDIFPKSTEPVDIEKFVNTFSSQNMEWFAEKGQEALDSEVDDIKGRWGYQEIQTIVDHITSNNIKYWSQKIMSNYRSALESRADEALQEKYEEFQDNPIQYLEDMGYEEYQWFDEYEWRDNYQSNGGGYGCDVDSLTSALEDNFPNFMNKYQNSLDFKEDGSLTCGIEFAQDNPPYMVGLDVAIEYLTDFFNEYDHQSHFKMTSKTGLHTNIGYLADTESGLTENYNLFKALMFLNHTYATKGVGFPSRERSHWTGDLKKPALNNIQQFVDALPEESSHEDILTKKSLMKKYLSRHFDELSGILTNQVAQQAQRMGPKSIGFNVNYTSRRNYIEFRYPGKEDVNIDSMTKALKYYAFIVKAAADPTFKRKEYIKDLIGFLNNLKGENPSKVSKLKFIKKLKKGDMLMSHNSWNNNLGMILKYNLIQATELDGSDNPELQATWDAQDRKRVLGRRAQSVVAAVMDHLPSGRRISQSLPTFYLGLKRGMVRKNTTRRNILVTLQNLRFDSDSPLGAEFYQNKEHAKTFQNNLDDLNYSLGSSYTDDAVKAIKAIYNLLKNSKNSIEFSKKLLEMASSEDALETFSLKWRTSPAEIQSEDTNNIEDIYLDEVRQYFKKYLKRD